jgi:hypothetical protein
MLQMELGKRQPALKKVLLAPRTKWSKCEIDWYGGKRRVIEMATGTALWYTPGYAPLPIRWVLVRDPLAEFDPTAFFATDQSAAPLQILAWFILRWSVEVTFEEARAHLGAETQRQWGGILKVGIFSKNRGKSPGSRALPILAISW